jgi:FemAB-related protein (PEP-CTERM system-associated)
MGYEVETFTGTAGEWDGFVRSQAGWTHFHLHGWRGVMEETLRHRSHYLAARDDRGQLAGILPLVRVRSRLFGDYLVSLPFVNYGGPLGSPQAVAELVDSATTLASDSGVGLLELRSREPLPSVTLPASHRKITVVLDLPLGDPETLWAALKAKVRSQVRRSRKEGATVRFGPEQVEPFYQVFSHHMRDLGTPVQSKGLFRSLLDRFGEDVWFGSAYLQDKPVACGCGFRWGDEFEMTWASSLRAFSRIAPNMLLYWSFMERAAEEGLTLFNFGRCTPGSGTHRFKRQWGSRDVKLWWYQQSPKGGLSATPSPQGRLYATAVKIWSHIPLPMTRALGPRISRLIP